MIIKDSPILQNLNHCNFLFRVEGQAVSNDDMRILHKVELELVKDILKFISKEHLNKILGKTAYYYNLSIYLSFYLYIYKSKSLSDIKHPTDISSHIYMYIYLT